MEDTRQLSSEYPYGVARINGFTKINGIIEMYRLEVGPVLALINTCTLELSHNGIERIPRSILEFKKLTILDLSRNHIQEIPGYLLLLKNLSVLSLSDNQLKGFPKVLYGLPNLQALDIRSNQIASVPTDITSFPALTSLDLSYNRSMQYPYGIPDLKFTLRIAHLGIYGSIGKHD
jgi:Leucine-rich repeat (LRR) protein